MEKPDEFWMLAALWRKTKNTWSPARTSPEGQEVWLTWHKREEKVKRPSVGEADQIVHRLLPAPLFHVRKTKRAARLCLAVLV